MSLHLSSVMLKATKFPELRPCSFQFGLVHLHRSSPRSPAGRPQALFCSAMNMFFTKCACQATGDDAHRQAGVRLAPRSPPRTDACRRAVCDQPFPDVPHFRVTPCYRFCPGQTTTVSWVVASLTIYLSLGERPVKMPVLTLTAPSFGDDATLGSPSKGLSGSLQRKAAHRRVANDFLAVFDTRIGPVQLLGQGGFPTIVIVFSRSEVCRVPSDVHPTTQVVEFLAIAIKLLK